jgi:hypothetical protein
MVPAVAPVCGCFGLSARLPISTHSPLLVCICARAWRSSTGNTALVAFNWQRPDDNGGSPIINYALFIDQGLGSSAFTELRSSFHERQTLTVSATGAFTVRGVGAAQRAWVVPVRGS